MRKKWLSRILVGIMMVNLLSPIGELKVHAENTDNEESTDLEENNVTGTCGIEATWTLAKDGTLTIGGTGAVSDSSGYEVHKEEITTIIVEEGITEIGAKAFYECTSAKKIVILNAQCVIEQAEDTFPVDTVLEGDSESTTHQYAKDFNRKFQCIEHQWGEWTSVEEASCTEAGSEKRVCSECDAEETKDVEAKGHTFEVCKGLDPTCTEEGYEEYACIICWDESVTYQEKIEPLGHSFTNYVSDGNVTCTEDGTETAKCDRCEETDTKTVEAIGHTNKVTKEAKAATCKEAGWTEEIRCEVCDILISESVAIESSGHNFVVTKEAKAATCTEGGWTEEKKCDVCNTIGTASRTLKAKGHNYVVTKAAKAATCTEDGWTESTKCDACGLEGAQSEAVKATGHNFETYIYNENATCTEDGTKTAKCTACDATDTLVETGTKLGHSFAEYVSDNNATCTEDGTKTAKCERCDKTDTITDENSALGHSLAAEWTMNKSNHWQECVVCHEKLELGIHEFQKDKCTICGYNRDHVHELTVVEAITPDCTNAGATSYYTCYGCDEWFQDAEGINKIEDKASVIVKPLGHDLEDATCFEPAICKRGCGYTAGNPLGHTGSKDVCDRCQTEKPAATITYAVTAKTLEYTGEEIEVPNEDILCGEATGEIDFTYYTDEACTTPIDDEAPVVPGVYYAKVTVAADDNYKTSTAEGVYVLTIKPARLASMTAINQKSNIKLSWAKSEEADGYIVYKRKYGTTSANYKVVKTITDNETLSCTDGNISQGTRYYYSIAAYKDTEDGTRIIGSKMTTATQIVRVKIKTMTNQNGSVKITWTKVENAAGYKVYRKAQGSDTYGFLKNIKNGTTTSYTDKYEKTIRNGKWSVYKVVPYYSSSSKVVLTSNTPTHYYLERQKITSVTAAKKAFTVKWTKNNSANGYEVWYSTSSSYGSSNTTKKTYTSKNTVSKKYTGLKAGKKYYVKVRSYKTVNGTKIYSAWSANKTVTTK